MPEWIFPVLSVFLLKWEPLSDVVSRSPLPSWAFSGPGGSLPGVSECVHRAMLSFQGVCGCEEPTSRSRDAQKGLVPQDEELAPVTTALWAAQRVVLAVVSQGDMQCDLSC